MRIAAPARGEVAARRRGLAPVVDERTRVLVLGSFPGVASLAARQYYAHPRNHFWPIVAALLEEPLVAAAYAHRLERIAHHGLGLWDIFVACRREGSSDGAIRDASRGQPARIARLAPALEVVAFNGNTAAKAVPEWRAAGYETLVLPSTSPAYTRPFGEKLAAWQALHAWLGTGAGLRRR
jgi:hypoxanthine-DNA glycosylase